MEPRTSTIELTGPASVIDPALDTFARMGGWRETVDGAPNPESREERARLMVRQFIMQTVEAGNVKAAQEAARLAAQAATAQAIDATTMTLIVA